MGRADMGCRCLVAAKRGEHLRGKEPRRGEGSLSLFGCSSGCCVCTTPSPSNPLLPSVFQSQLLLSVSPHSSRHILILIALSHLFQIITGLELIIYCMQQRASQGGEVEKR